MLKTIFFKLLTNYSDDESQIKNLWSEIEKNYSHKKRHYHSLHHLENLFVQLSAVKADIQHWNVSLFTLFYHDIVYDPKKSNNEEKSAELAEQRMNQLLIPFTYIEKCKAQILATKSHLISTDKDTNYFTDADLSILGQDTESYLIYAKNVRKEYSIYPDILYNPGRKKVLNHFLSMERIYKTEYFHTNFENQAKQNLRFELNLLT